MSQPTSSQILRRDYLLLILEGKSDSAARRQLSIKGTRFVERLKEALVRDCSLADAHRTGRPALYTDDLLEEALAWFDRNAWQQLNKEELVAALQEDGILPEDACVEGFYPAFKSYLVDQGLRLKWGQRTLTFALSPQHEIWREEWCHEHQHAFTERELGAFYFTDEIVIEESGHPKGTVRWWAECI